MLHSVTCMGFTRPDEENVSVALDLASMQFGNKGRGNSGDFFILDTMDGWYGCGYVEKIVQGCEAFKTSRRISSGNDAEREKWYKRVTVRVKERGEASLSCGLCGKPDATKRCGAHRSTTVPKHTSCSIGTKYGAIPKLRIDVFRQSQIARLYMN